MLVHKLLLNNGNEKKTKKKKTGNINAFREKQDIISTIKIFPLSSVEILPNTK